MNKFVILILVLSAICILAEDFNQIYSEGVKLIQSGQPSQARVKFQEVKNSPVDMGLHDNAEYWIAVSYLDEKQYDKAIDHYRYAQQLPDGNKAAAAQYELAMAYTLNGDTASAIMEFYKVAILYPTAEENLRNRAYEQIASYGVEIHENNPESGPMTPALAALIPHEEIEDSGPVIAESGPLAGTELPVPKKRNTAVKTEVKSEDIVAASSITPEAETPTETDTNQVNEEQDEEKEFEGPAKTAVDKDGKPLNSLPADQDPRSLIRPEDKMGL